MSELSNSLGTMMDTLNEVLERAEAVLRRHGVAGQLPGPGPKHLGFKKLGDRWRLVWNQEGSEPATVLGSSQEMRLKAAEKIPELDRVLATVASERGYRIQAAVESLERWVEEHEAEAE